MIVVTGAAGFIGSCLTRSFNERGRDDLVLVDDFSSHQKMKNLQGVGHAIMIPRTDFFQWLKREKGKVEFVFHLGARTNTAEKSIPIFDRLNLNYSKELYTLCSEKQIPLLYASSAATYGAGEHGYADSHEVVDKLKPLNPYGQSKQDFDRWVLQQKTKPPFWAGLKFFNVYGPNEYHKGIMASAIFHMYHQIASGGRVVLFRSHNPNVQDGEQKRDFVYVKDVVEVCHFMMEQQKDPGLYNLGTGKERSFSEVANSLFRVMEKTPCIAFEDTPESIRGNYQYFTRAQMDKLRNAGYQKAFTTLEDGIKNYVKTYLEKGRYFHEG